MHLMYRMFPWSVLFWACFGLGYWLGSFIT